jgi:hypothetical protein
MSISASLSAAAYDLLFASSTLQLLLLLLLVLLLLTSAFMCCCCCTAAAAAAVLVLLLATASIGAVNTTSSTSSLIRLSSVLLRVTRVLCRCTTGLLFSVTGNCVSEWLSSQRSPNSAVEPLLNVLLLKGVVNVLIVGTTGCSADSGCCSSASNEVTSSYVLKPIGIVLSLLFVIAFVVVLASPLLLLSLLGVVVALRTIAGCVNCCK